MYASRSFLYCSCAALKESIDGDGEGVGSATADETLMEKRAADSATATNPRFLMP